MTASSTESSQAKRPLSIVVCLTVFTLFMVLFAQSVFEIGLAHMNGFFVIHAVLTVIAMVALLVYQRSRITYYVTCAALLGLVLKGVYVVLKYPSHMTLPVDSLVNRLPAGILLFGFCLLLWRFAMGNPCRAFYGFRA